MAQQGMPSPIEVYEGAVAQMQPIIGGIRPDQLTASTPCSKWDVQSLINHNIKVSQNVRSIITGGAGVDPFSVSHPIPSEGAEVAFQASTNFLLAAVKGAGVLEKEVDTPFGRMQVGQFLMMPIADIVIHKWDLAKATNQDTSLDSGLAEVCYAVLSPAVEGGRQGGFFGPEVTIPISASIQDKLLGISGRQP